MERMSDGLLVGAGLSFGLTDGRLPVTTGLFGKLQCDPKCAKILGRYRSKRIDVVLTELDLQLAETTRAPERQGLLNRENHP